MKKKMCFIMIFLLLSSLLCAQQSKKIAFLRINNLDPSPRHDYLAGIIQGLLLYDLAHSKGLQLVDRTSLDRVLDEQQLQLSDLVENQDKAIKIGQLFKADFLLKGEYIFMGRDVLVTIRLIDVETAHTHIFSKRGSQENTIHSLSEEMIKLLSGKEVKLISDQGKRSIISLQDESPGSISLYSPMQSAEIFLDEKFIGYTIGQKTIPFIINEIEPGNHKLRVHLAKGFGVIKMPEIIFQDWEEEIEIKAGKNIVLRDKTRDFTRSLLDIKRLASFSYSINQDNIDKELNRKIDLSFKDRKGNKIDASVQFKARIKDNYLDVEADFLYQGEKTRILINNKGDEKNTAEQSIGLIDIKLESSRKYNKNFFSYLFERNDVSLSMWKNP